VSDPQEPTRDGTPAPPPLAVAAALAFDRREIPGQLDAAVDLYEQCREATPSYYPAWFALARAYALRDEWGKALALWEHLICEGLWPPTETGLEGWDRQALLAAHAAPPASVGGVDPAQVLADAVAACRLHFRDDATSVNVLHRQRAPVRCLQASLRRLFLIVLENAYEAVHTGIAASPLAEHADWYEPLEDRCREVQARIDVVIGGHGGAMVVEVRDYGIGLPCPWQNRAAQIAAWLPRRKHLFAGDEERTRLFLRGCLPLDDRELCAWLFIPGWTSKGKGWQRPRPSLGNGPGLGLYMARQILCKLGGNIRVDRAQGAGTVVTLEMPCAGAGAERPT